MWSLAVTKSGLWNSCAASDRLPEPDWSASWASVSMSGAISGGISPELRRSSSAFYSSDASYWDDPPARVDNGARVTDR